MRRPAAGLLAAAVTLASISAGAGCGVKGPPRPSGAPEKPAPRDASQAAPPAAPGAPGAEVAR